MKLPVMLSVEDAAVVLDVTPQTIRKWAAAGRIEARKTGRAWVVVLDPVAYAAAVAALAARRTAEQIVALRGKGRRIAEGVGETSTTDLLAELDIEPASLLGEYALDAAQSIVDAALAGAKTPA